MRFNLSMLGSKNIIPMVKLCLNVKRNLKVIEVKEYEQA